MKRMLFAAVAAACLAGCVDQETAQRVLQDDGYTDIVVADHSGWFAGCGKDDFYATPFEATTAAGRRIKGVVCSGVWKAATIRRY